ncbi:MAG: hypothetical protein KKC46_05570 [Proteobacteria bacterium]|nr:hypothetical protein [Pseudomonadota bacterium]
MEPFLITASITVDGETYSLSFDLNSLKEPLTERKARQVYDFMGPSMTKVLRDHGKIINPLVFD